MIKKLSYLGLAVLAIAIMVWAFMPKPIPVEVAPVVRADFQMTVEEDGKTRAKDVYVISSPVKGNLLRIPLKAGDAVKKGDIVASIVPATSQLLDIREEMQLHEQVGAAESTFLKAKVMASRAEAAYKTAVSELKRNKELAKKGFVSESELEQKQLDVDLKKRELESAKHNIHAAEHDFNRAKYALEHYKDAYEPQLKLGNTLEIKSPITGHIIKINRDSAGAIMDGSPIMEVADISKIEVVVDILSTDAVKIQPNAKAYIKRWGRTEPLMGTVRLIEPGGFTKISALGVEEQRVNVIIDFTSPKEKWKNLGAGFQVDAEIIISSLKDQLVIPVSALFRDGAKWAVFKYDNGVARKQIIEINDRNPEFAAIKKGLNEGDKVIVYPGDRIKDSVRVRIR